jgi:hypothetical protein
MVLDNALAITPSSELASEDPTSTPKEKLLVNLQQFFSPKILFIQDIRGIDFTGNSSGQVFKAFSCETA